MTIQEKIGLLTQVRILKLGMEQSCKEIDKLNHKMARYVSALSDIESDINKLETPSNQEQAA